MNDWVLCDKAIAEIMKRRDQIAVLTNQVERLESTIIVQKARIEELERQVRDAREGARRGAIERMARRDSDDIYQWALEVSARIKAGEQGDE